MNFLFNERINHICRMCIQLKIIGRAKKALLLINTGMRIIRIALNQPDLAKYNNF